ncbi:hypothetical protein D9M68_125540 [compost metagenome]|uniref:Uncharacterized protein n=1 Tax=Pseudomonas jinjuensis TaxID=198616 RepID=A0A1G9YEL0_9PSED|nr:hypothetical protein [Pseudomonas jinjuensis]SDN07658.1 hypothetical protein SAMN05216193_10128 [Pseudomonas jinjuensis]
MLKRTLLGAAIASVMFASAANAGVISIIVGQSSNATVTQNSPGDVDQYAPGQGNYKAGTSIETGANYGSRAANITIAQEIFGNLSESTQFDLPDVDYAIDLNKAVNASLGHTIKLTLDRTVAQYANAVTANQIKIGTLPAGQGFTITSGTGVNTLALTLDAAGAAEIASATAAEPGKAVVHFMFRTNNTSNGQPARVDHLRAPLQGDATFVGQSWNPKVSLLNDSLNERRFQVTMSAQLDTTTGPNAGDAKNNDSAQPLMVFTSLPAVYWDVLNTNNYGQYQVLHSLDLANQDKAFDPAVSTQPGLTSPQNYGANYARLGAVRLGVNPDVLNEEGRTVFGFNGSDTLTSYISGNFAGLQSVGLTTDNCQTYASGSAAVAYSWDAAAIAGATGSDGIAKLALNLKNADINQVYNICVKADGVNPMVAQQSFAVGPLKVDFGNVRYVDRVINGGELDHFWKSSCVASLFNLPGGNNQDAFFIRLTNTSDNGRIGKVRGVLFDQNGKRYPDSGSAYITDQSGKSVLKAHETGVYSVTEVAQAFGVNGSDWNGVGGRARLVLEGEFPTCEALGLIRTPNGTLVNMTSTTQGNFNGDSGPSTVTNHKAGNNRN